MLLIGLLVPLMATNTLGISGTEYLAGIQELLPQLNYVNLFDGPPSISSAPITSPVQITTPTREEMVYYGYYTASVNCAYGTLKMDCNYCLKIIGDITDFVVLNNATHDTSALVTVSEKRNEIVVAYRGSENLWNAVLDFYFVNTTPTEGSPIKIHRGFYIATMSLLERVVRAIGGFQMKKPAYKDYKIVLAGHSLGAAMARVTQYFLISTNQFPGVVYEVYTYGEPRNGNKYYADYLNNLNVKTIRVTNRADLVCHVAPTSILGTQLISDYYVHPLKEYFIDGSVEKFADPSTYEDATCSNKYGPAYSIVDHLIYFDVNHAQCISDAFEILSIPVILQPVDVLPPLPKKIQITLSDLAELLRLIAPILG